MDNNLSQGMNFHRHILFGVESPREILFFGSGIRFLLDGCKVDVGKQLLKMGSRAFHWQANMQVIHVTYIRFSQQLTNSSH
jgi:hypothetical protein